MGFLAKKWEIRNRLEYKNSDKVGICVVFPKRGKATFFREGYRTTTIVLLKSGNPNCTPFHPKPLVLFLSIGSGAIVRSQVH